jgi:hypothetical protein
MPLGALKRRPNGSIVRGGRGNAVRYANSEETACCRCELTEAQYYPLYYCPEGNVFSGYLLTVADTGSHDPAEELRVTGETIDFCAVLGQLTDISDLQDEPVLNVIDINTTTLDWESGCVECCDCGLGGNPSSVAVSVAIPAPCGVTVPVVVPEFINNCSWFIDFFSVDGCGDDLLSVFIAWGDNSYPEDNLNLPEEVCYWLMLIEWFPAGAPESTHIYYIRWGPSPLGVYTALGFTSGFPAFMVVS